MPRSAPSAGLLYGLGAYGKEGVTMALEIIRRELDITMALCGKRDIRSVGPDLIYRPYALERLTGHG